jgi:hypothetical protein
MSADQGNAYAQNEYGNCLKNGEGVARNLPEAVQYFRMSVDQGNAAGENSYGMLLLRGEGIDKNVEEAMRYFKMSADKENAEGQNNYGVQLFLQGNVIEGAEYLKKSAGQGNRFGQNNLGVCLLKGEGVGLNVGEGLRYLKMSADKKTMIGEANYVAHLMRGEVVEADPVEPQRLLAMRNRRDILCLAIYHFFKGGVLGYDGRIEEKSEMIRNFNDFREIEDIGRIGSSAVKVMEQEVRKRIVAVKFYSGDNECDSEQVIENLEKYVELRHPCIVPIVGWDVEVEVEVGVGEISRARIGSEFMKNGSLGEVLSKVREGVSPIFWSHTNIAKMIVGIVVGMKFLHSKGVFHGSLNPCNLFMSEEYGLRIGDFWNGIFEDQGYVWKNNESHDYNNNHSMNLYVAPEVLKNPELPLTSKSDVFSFGLIFYEILVGKSVFERFGNVVRSMKGLLRGKRAIIPNFVDSRISGLIERCWSSVIEERPSFDEILEILETTNFVFSHDVDSEAVREFMSKVRIRAIQ